MYEEIGDYDYRDFIASSEMKTLTDTNDVRIEEEMTRPRVELWPDEDGWDQWVLSHSKDRMSILCNLPSMKASPFCALGYH
jgi:hypothetical protein